MGAQLGVCELHPTVNTLDGNGWCGCREEDFGGSVQSRWQCSAAMLLAAGYGLGQMPQSWLT
jgi:hypothetical protein